MHVPNWIVDSLIQFAALHSFRSPRLVNTAFEETVWGWKSFFFRLGNSSPSLDFMPIYFSGCCAFLCSDELSAFRWWLQFWQHAGSAFRWDRIEGHFTSSCLSVTVCGKELLQVSWMLTGSQFTVSFSLKVNRGLHIVRSK